VQLRDPRFPERVFKLLADTHMRPADLELEITEGILLEEASTASEALRIFRSAGIRIALDDFGTGYSSLNYLKRYPVDRIKIDRSFVSQLAPGSVSRAIVQAMVTLAHALNIEVTAEGVETKEQMDILVQLGCNVFQGFLLSPPVSRDALEARLRADPHSTSTAEARVA
jgi:EAL domain-containing protein (putative c-di-GMP-specific phosphodiesterase class I)